VEGKAVEEKTGEARVDAEPRRGTLIQRV